MTDAPPADPGMDSGEKGPGSTMRLLLRILDRPTKQRLLLAAIISGILALLETVAIVTVLPLVSIATGAPVEDGAIGVVWRALGEPQRNTFGLILVFVVVGIFIAKDLFAMAFAWWQSGFVTTKRVGLSTSIFRSIMQEPFADFRHRSIGETMRTMYSAVGAMFSSVNALISAVSAGLTVLAILVALVLTTPVQALLALVYFGLGAFAYLRIVRPRISALGQDLMTGSKEYVIAGMQGLQGFKEVKLRHSADFFVSRFEHGVSTTEFAARGGNFLSSITRYLLEILFILGVGALLVHSFSTSTASQAVGSLALFVAAGFRLLPNISTLVGAVNSFRMGRASTLLVAEEMAKLREREESGTVSTTVTAPFDHEIQLDGVRFQYRGATSEVLRGIDLTIPLGGSVAFVGSSGAGKTTLVDVVLGLLRPTGGRLLIDGLDVTDRLEEWQRNCAMVAQDVFIAEDTIRKNVLFDVAPEDADPARLDEAVTKAQLQDVVDSMPGGLDADVGDWGSRLSGGQRQRIGIARALYRRPKLLVLDEATSALDNETERRITETIDALRGDTTVIVVAHRLSTVKNVDMVVYMEDGRIAGAGTFQELRQVNVGFSRLVELGDLGGTARPSEDEPGAGHTATSTSDSAS